MQVAPNVPTVSARTWRGDLWTSGRKQEVINTSFSVLPKCIQRVCQGLYALSGTEDIDGVPASSPARPTGRIA